MEKAMKDLSTSEPTNTVNGDHYPPTIGKKRSLDAVDGVTNGEEKKKKKKKKVDSDS
jgi:hypothetical protein